MDDPPPFQHTRVLRAAFLSIRSANPALLGPDDPQAPSDHWVGHHDPQHMPSVEQRAIGPAGTLYLIHRDVSARAHGSILASTLQFAIGADDE